MKIHVKWNSDKTKFGQQERFSKFPNFRVKWVPLYKYMALNKQHEIHVPLVRVVMYHTLCAVDGRDIPSICHILTIDDWRTVPTFTIRYANQYLQC